MNIESSFFAKSTFFHAGQREKNYFFALKLLFSLWNYFFSRCRVQREKKEFQREKKLFKSEKKYFHARATFFHAGITFSLGVSPHPPPSPLWQKSHLLAPYAA
jgi:hypothetical protein